MEVLCKYISAVLAALCALLCPITPLITTAMFFIFVDFVTGVAASYAVAHREGRAWWIESRKAWRTILKAGFTAVAMVHRLTTSGFYEPTSCQSLYRFCMWCGVVVILGECFGNKSRTALCVARSMGETPCREGGGG